MEGAGFLTPVLDAIAAAVGGDPYRAVTLALALATLAVRGFFRWRAEVHRERRASRREGAGRGLWALFPGLLSFADVPLPAGARIVGAAIGTLGVGLLTWVHVALGRAFSPTLVVRTGAPLVTAGPYARVRHPMYVAFLLIALGVALTTANVLVAAVGLGAVAFVMIVRTPREERMMLDAHGDAWRAYAARTGRFAPSVGARGA
jgi:protein-S-isoprenylcysteine O-methyltransferase Ste14